MSRHYRLPATGLLAVGIVALIGAITGAASPAGKTRVYYIAADEVTWNFAPSGRDEISGQPFDDVQKPFAEGGPRWLGREVRKSLYREYADSTFTTLKPRPAEWAYLGYLGPLLRATVGDTIRIVFRNNTHHPASMHPHGVFYNKDSEGAPYADRTGAADKADDGVPPRGTHTYVWPVPERAGPAPGEGGSVFWMYHSHTHEVEDVNAGLMGPMIVTARGMTRSDGTPTDVDREVVITFAEFDENNSRHFRHNLRTYAPEADSVKIDTVFAELTNRYAQYNFKETLNGFFFGALPMPTMRVGERVRWYVMATTNFEFHSPHWHGNVVVANHMRTDVVALLPMSMLVADMVPDNPGVWLFHCHVANHLLMGMQGRYEVLPRTAAAR